MTDDSPYADPPPDAIRRGPKVDAARKLEIQQQHAAALSKDASVVRAGVSLTWLQHAFKMDLRTVKNHLGALKPIGDHGPRKSDVYDFGEAVSRLAKPQMAQLENYLKTLRTQDMPTHLQESYWGALRKKQLWEIAAGDLWKTDDVLDVFAETFKLLKTTTQLWVDDLDQDGDMEPEQRERLTEMVDGLMKELHARLIDMPKVKKTGPSLDDPEAMPDSLRDAAPVEDEDLIG